MTIVFSAASPDLIVMTVDSVVARDFADRREYDTGRKAFRLDGVGCVAWWGVRSHNRISEFLADRDMQSDIHSVEDLTMAVDRYLRECFRPRELCLGNVGYHVAGFDQEGRPRLHHVFWGFDLPRLPQQTERWYKNNDHSPQTGGVALLYNGRNDLAEAVVHTLFRQVQAGREIRFNLESPVDLARFGDFVARFAAELTPEVGPPFVTFLISPQNKITWSKNDTFCPIGRDELAAKLDSLE